MKFFQEITEWRDRTPNHVYLLNDSKSRMSGYVPSGTDQLIMLKKPMNFSSRYRKFREVENRWNYTEQKPENPQWHITGSRGDTYTVEQTDQGLTCSCSGFRFRGKCRHVTEIADLQHQETV